MPIVNHTPPEASPCLNREHYPPNMMMYRPGRYTWECPSCHQQTTFTIPEIRSDMPRKWEGGRSDVSVTFPEAS